MGQLIVLLDCRHLGSVKMVTVCKLYITMFQLSSNPDVWFWRLNLPFYCQGRKCHTGNIEFDLMA